MRLIEHDRIKVLRVLHHVNCGFADDEVTLVDDVQARVQLLFVVEDLFDCVEAKQALQIVVLPVKQVVDLFLVLFVVLSSVALFLFN